MSWKSVVREFVPPIVMRVRRPTPAVAVQNGETFWERSIDRQMQIGLCAQWRDTRRRLSLSEVEFSSYSQNGEDGVLLYIFSIIGSGIKTVVEICAGDGIECNAANLIINHGWRGLLFDGDGAAIERGRRFYSQRTNSWRLRRLPPTLVHAWITAETVDNLIQSNGVTGEIDLLSIDVDGNDFWVWKAITCISPRVVVAEYNNRFAADQSLTIPYDPNFVVASTSTDDVGYFGASLPALTKLAEEKGYRLIGANSPNTNAFFMRNDVGLDQFNAVDIASCLSSEYAKHQHETKWSLLRDRRFVTV
jgi:hypothetical protein